MNSFALDLTLMMTVLPIIGLLVYIHKMDELKPEPIATLIATLVAGALGGIVGHSIVTWTGLPSIYSISGSANFGSTLLAVSTGAFTDCLLQIFIMITAMVFNKDFDEQLDGIVYAVFIALAYVFGRNLIYLWQHADFDLAMLRSILLVPIAYFCGVLIGYYYSRLRFRHPRKLYYDIPLLIAIPLLCRIILDMTIIKVGSNLSLWQGTLLTLFLIFLAFFFMYYTQQRIESHLGRDRHAGVGDNELL